MEQGKKIGQFIWTSDQRLDWAFGQYWKNRDDVLAERAKTHPTEVRRLTHEDKTEWYSNMG